MSNGPCFANLCEVSSRNNLIAERVSDIGLGSSPGGFTE
jgi:hypothetical protein